MRVCARARVCFGGGGGVRRRKDDEDEMSLALLHKLAWNAIIEIQSIDQVMILIL